MRLTILTQQVSPYHVARFRAVMQTGADISVVSVMNDADFSEFLVTETDDLPITRLYDGQEHYAEAVQSGQFGTDIRKLLTILDPDVLAVAGWATPESFAGIEWAKDESRRLVVFSDSQRDDASRFALREWIKSRVVRMCDAALVAGRSHKNYIVELGMPADFVWLGYDVVDNRHFSEGAQRARAESARHRQALGVPTRYILASGRFLPKKNFPKLVRCYAEAVAGATDPPHLVVLGDGVERSGIEATIAANKVNTLVHLVGFRGYTYLPAIYGLADAFVHIPTSEQWGLVINEAAAAGLPIVASHECGASGELVVNETNGYVVNAKDSKAITNALHKLATLNDDDRFRMGRRSQELVHQWSPETHAKNLIEAARAATARPARSLTGLDRMILRGLSRQRISKVA